MRLLLKPPNLNSPVLPTSYASLATPTEKRWVMNVGKMSMLSMLLLKIHEADDCDYDATDSIIKGSMSSEVSKVRGEKISKDGSNEDDYDDCDDSDDSDGWEVVTPAYSGTDKVKSMYWDEERLADKLHGLEKRDPYDILGLKLKRWESTQAEIKERFRQLSLAHHPDRRAMNSTETKEAKKNKKSVEIVDFKLVTSAYELLGDPVRRKQYDSLDAFDDHIPKTYRRLPSRKEDEDEAFLTFFVPVFKRQAKFSTQRPVPELGDRDTTPMELRRFYAFWENFRSWRDFGLLGECDLAEAEDREERRWMQRQNKNEADRTKREEMKRLSAFVCLAKEHDPRMRRIREARAEAEAARKKEVEDAARLRAQKVAEEREAIRQAEAAIALAREEEEKTKEAGEKAVSKRAKEAKRAELKRLRKEVKALGAWDGPWRKRAGDLVVIASCFSFDELVTFRDVLCSGDGMAASAAIDAALSKCLML